MSLTLSRRRKYLPTTRCGWHAAHCITAKYLFFTTWLTVSSPSVLIAPLRIRLAIPQMPVEGREAPSLASRGGRGRICTADFTGAFRPLYISFAVCKFLLFEIPAPAACSRARSDLDGATWHNNTYVPMKIFERLDLWCWFNAAYHSSQSITMLLAERIVCSLKAFLFKVNV